MADLVVRAVSSLGVVSVGLLMLLENVFPPIPSELIMPLAGYLSSQEKLSFAGSIIAGTVGSAAGASFWYWLGRRWGREGLRTWAGKHGHWVGLATTDVDRSHRWFQRHGYAAVFLGRLVPGVRSFISLPAGFGRMPLLPFLGLTLLGSAIWSGGSPSLAEWSGAGSTRWTATWARSAGWSSACYSGCTCGGCGGDAAGASGARPNAVPRRGNGRASCTSRAPSEHRSRGAWSVTRG